MRDPVIIDIETIPGNLNQMALYKSVKCARCNHNPESSTSKKDRKNYCQECDEEAALKWPTCQVICITAKILDGDIFCWCDPDEYQVLSQAYDTLSEISPKPWIGFNHNEFDIIQLRMRGLIHHVPFHDILPKGGKYDKNSIDLYDALVQGKWNKQQSATLEMFATMLGFPELLYGRGSQVREWFANNQLDEIKKHNIGDVLATEQLFKRVEGLQDLYTAKKTQSPKSDSTQTKKSEPEDPEEVFSL